MPAAPAVFANVLLPVAPVAAKGVIESCSWQDAPSPIAADSARGAAAGAADAVRPGADVRAARRASDSLFANALPPVGGGDSAGDEPRAERRTAAALLSPALPPAAGIGAGEGSAGHAAPAGEGQVGWGGAAFSSAGASAAVPGSGRTAARGARRGLRFDDPAPPACAPAAPPNPESNPGSDAPRPQRSPGGLAEAAAVRALHDERELSGSASGAVAAVPRGDGSAGTPRCAPGRGQLQREAASSSSSSSSAPASPASAASAAGGGSGGQPGPAVSPGAVPAAPCGAGGAAAASACRTPVARADVPAGAEAVQRQQSSASREWAARAPGRTPAPFAFTPARAPPPARSEPGPDPSPERGGGGGGLAGPACAWDVRPAYLGGLGPPASRAGMYAFGPALKAGPDAAPGARAPPPAAGPLRSPGPAEAAGAPRGGPAAVVGGPGSGPAASPAALPSFPGGRLRDVVPSPTPRPYKSNALAAFWRCVLESWPLSRRRLRASVHLPAKCKGARHAQTCIMQAIA
jgi:hypothetical protein